MGSEFADGRTAVNVEISGIEQAGDSQLEHKVVGSQSLLQNDNFLSRASPPIIARPK